MQSKIEVGILFAPSVKFILKGRFTQSGSKKVYTGEARAEYLSEKEASFSINGHGETIPLPLVLIPENEADSAFDLLDVTIGINFHWERKEDQRFRGGLKIIAENGILTAINILSVEEYLRSVISSEMSATSSQELLKAHAVISRSWLLAQIEKNRKLAGDPKPSGITTNDHEHIKWYDREDHDNFHVCADDHCQRYQGITKASTHAVDIAISETWGEVLTYDGNICDARYSKCCGGIAEIFENVWEPVNHPYLTSVLDNHRNPPGFEIQLNTEEKAEKWINGSPEAFCNTTDKEVLSQVLNDYDQETFDFFRWKKELTQEEITTLLQKKIGIHVGKIKELTPIERGASGRLIKLKITGTEKTITIGKELEIRKAFSDSHLYSSAFTIKTTDLVDGIPQKFIFTGAGWGHGVGLCQIGAAVMGARGYNYRQILLHYFRGAEIEKKY